MLLSPRLRGLKRCPPIGFIAHMDTVDAVSGKNVHPQVVEHYDGADVVLNPETGLKLSPKQFPELKQYCGKNSDHNRRNHFAGFR